ncbi:MAG TPA: 2-oxo acid dehydrogenase subunit E2 [Steroidobacteraceae bacterium]|nr:2-oxo acid dehydrogenase subunit E2 [Steroidobacteraceae bacterium]
MNAAVRLVEVRVPDLGNFKDVAVIDVLVKPGESIETEAPLVTLETEKATMDVPSTTSGVVEKIHVAKGGTVSTGDLIATVRASAEAGTDATPAAQQAPAAKQEAKAAEAPAAKQETKVAEAPVAEAKPAPAAKPAEGPASSGAREAAKSAGATGSASGAGGVAQAAVKETVPAAAREGAVAPAGVANTKYELPPINEPGFSRAHASPSVRKFARELGVDLTRVKGSGFKGRITQDDVKGFVKSYLASPTAVPGAKPPGGGAGLPQVPPVDFAQFGPTELKPLSRIQKISGPRLHASWVNIPHVTQFDEADITDLEAARNELKARASQAGIKLTPLAFIIRACVKALQEFPQFNASLDPSGANLVLKKYFHIGFAADTPNGLVVPVVREADRKDVYEIARALAELSEKARGGKLTPNDMQGGCFTVSSLGGIGGTAFTPIINAPEVAILGISRSAMKPVYRDGTFVPRLMLPLSLSYDHRVIDGAAAARFTTFLAETLANVSGLIEAVP